MEKCVFESVRNPVHLAVVWWVGLLVMVGAVLWYFFVDPISPDPALFFYRLACIGFGLALQFYASARTRIAQTAEVLEREFKVEICGPGPWIVEERFWAGTVSWDVIRYVVAQRDRAGGLRGLHIGRREGTEIRVEGVQDMAGLLECLKARLPQLFPAQEASSPTLFRPQFMFPLSLALVSVVLMAHAKSRPVLGLAGALISAFLLIDCVRNLHGKPAFVMAGLGPRWCCRHIRAVAVSKALVALWLLWPSLRWVLAPPFLPIPWAICVVGVLLFLADSVLMRRGRPLLWAAVVGPPGVFPELRRKVVWLDWAIAATLLASLVYFGGCGAP